MVREGSKKANTRVASKCTGRSSKNANDLKVNRKARTKRNNPHDT